MKARGTATIKDIDALLAWQNAITIEQSNRIYDEANQWSMKLLGGFPKDAPETVLENIIRDRAREMYKIDVFTVFCSKDSDAYKEAEQKALDKRKEQNVGVLTELYQYSGTYNQPFQVAVWDETFAYLYFGNMKNGIVISNPGRYFDYHEFPVMDEIPVAMLKSKLGAVGANEGSAILPASVDGQLTKAALREAVSQGKDKLNELNKEMKSIRDGEAAELAVMKAEIEKLQQQMEDKKNELMLQLEDKMGNMEEQVAQLEGQIFLLDSQIYAIQCAEGLTVSFTQLRKGRNAPDNTPIIIYQKLRFLDEDLGRMASMYTLDWAEVGMFEEFLKHNPVALETFAPDQRCVSLVRLSRTNSRLDVSSRFPYSNLMAEYEYYHGRTVGIIIRNGDNLYLGWTDEDRIRINDDLILSRATTTVIPEESKVCMPGNELYQKRKDREARKKAREEHMTFLEGLVSRVFVFSVLQGVVNNTEWLPLPAGVSISKQSPYVRFSLADMCLEDHRFVDFGQLIDLVNYEVMVGDPLLTIQWLHPSRGQYSHNDRGRGYADRTHDVRAADCTIYKANLIENNVLVPMMRYRYKYSHIDSEPEWREGVCRASANLSEDCEILGEAPAQYADRHVYVSLEKDNWKCNDVAPRANFELYSGEYINLEFMNSVWLTWAITTQSLGNWRIKGEKVLYSYAIKYLNTALDYIKDREAEEKAAIDTIDENICKDADWPLHLTWWKMMLSRDKDARSVRKITPFQAKRFVTWIKNGMPGLVEYGLANPEEGS